jgi:endonuclease III
MAKITAAHSKKMAALAEALDARYGACKPPQLDNFIEVMMYQILLLGANDRVARKALASLREEFVNWNDMRVGSVREIQDILGPKYPRCREKAEDLHHLLADFYTAFRRMELDDIVRTQEGIETLRALPETTLVREDMVEWGLLQFCGVDTFPCNDEQFELLRFLGGVPKNAEYEDTKSELVSTCDADLKTRLSIGLREHCDMLEQHDEYDPQPIEWGQDADEAPKKPAAKKKTGKTTK